MNIPSGILVHRGFYKSYIGIQRKIQDAVLELSVQYPTYQVVFTGHSLGGVMATLAAIDFADKPERSDKVWVYTYGQPRIGNKAFAEYLETLSIAKRIHRVTRSSDPGIKYINDSCTFTAILMAFLFLGSNLYPVSTYAQRV